MAGAVPNLTNKAKKSPIAEAIAAGNSNISDLLSETLRSKKLSANQAGDEIIKSEEKKRDSPKSSHSSSEGSSEEDDVGADSDSDSENQAKNDTKNPVMEQIKEHEKEEDEEEEVPTMIKKGGETAEHDEINEEENKKLPNLGRKKSGPKPKTEPLTVIKKIASCPVQSKRPLAGNPALGFPNGIQSNTVSSFPMSIPSQPAKAIPEVVPVVMLDLSNEESRQKSADANKVFSFALQSIAATRNR